eukprot:4437129-Prymnesium_polylepis.1
MKLLPRRSRVSRRTLPAPCRCALRAERPKIFAGPRVGVCVALPVMCTFSKNKTRVCLMGPDQVTLEMSKARHGGLTGLGP